MKFIIFAILFIALFSSSTAFRMTNRQAPLGKCTDLVWPESTNPGNEKLTFDWICHDWYRCEESKSCDTCCN